MLVLNICIRFDRAYILAHAGKDGGTVTGTRGGGEGKGRGRNEEKHGERFPRYGWKKDRDREGKEKGQGDERGARRRMRKGFAP